MRNCAKSTLRTLLAGCLFGASILMILVQEEARAANGDEGRQLGKGDVRLLHEGLNEMLAMASKLRVLLRSLRKQIGIDSREVLVIERSISQSQTDLQRLIAMHQREAVNSMRAHFLADDLRRKADALHEALAYLIRRDRKRVAGEEARLDENVLKEYADLQRQLGRYSELLTQDVELLQARGL